MVASNAHSRDAQVVDSVTDLRAGSLSGELHDQRHRQPPPGRGNVNALCRFERFFLTMFKLLPQVCHRRGRMPAHPGAGENSARYP